MGTYPYPAKALNVPIRWMIKRDYPQVLQIENASFEFTWAPEDFFVCGQSRNCSGFVAETNVGSGKEETIGKKPE